MEYSRIMHEQLKQHIESILQEKITAFPLHSGKVTTTSGKRYFLKTGQQSHTYACETHGLAELHLSQSVDVVKPVAHGDNFILTEFVQQGQAPATFFEDFGRKFARMHRHTGDTFGFYEDNFIGENRQLNLADDAEKHDWIVFYFQKRLLYQYQLAEKKTVVSQGLRKNFMKLENTIHSILRDSDEPPTLLHGDLWSGNFLCNEKGKAVLIDPAVYYGHREADLAMTKLFGGFPASFYQAYHREYPLQAGWEYREGLYKLYHVLNHLNIFGSGYLAEAEWIVQAYTS